MTATNHALTGAVIALVIKQPVLAVPLAFLSHFVIDIVPHFDAGPDSPKLAKSVIFIDSIIAGTLTILIPIFLPTDTSPWLIFAGMFAAMSPDLVWGWRYYKLRDLQRVTSQPMSLFSSYHQKIQWSETRKGVFVEIFWLLLMSWSIIWLV